MTGGARLRSVPALRTGNTTDARASAGARVSTVVVQAPRTLDTATVSDPDWRRRARCSTSDPEIFFPIDPDRQDLTAPALTVCRSCPVRASCLADVMATEDPARRWGVTGVTTPADRSALHRRVLGTGGEAA